MAAVCVYDNPKTMARECWRDGRLTCCYSYELLPPISRDPIPAEYYFFGANVGNWTPGQVVGDPSAVGEEGK